VALPSGAQSIRTEEPPPVDLDRVLAGPSTRPPAPPRPALLDSLAPVDFVAEQRRERARQAVARRAELGRLGLAGSIGGLAALLVGALVGGTLRAGTTPDRDRTGTRAAAAAATGPTSAPGGVGRELTPDDSSPRPAAAPAPEGAPGPGPASEATAVPGGNDDGPEDGTDRRAGSADPAARGRVADGAPAAAGRRARTQTAASGRPGRRSRTSRPPPSRAEVQQALEGVRPAVEACAAGVPGVAQLHVTVADSGRVRHARVAGHFAGRPEGSCMARAVRRARFPADRQDGFKVVYPYRLTSSD